MSDKHPIPDEALDSDIAILGKKGIMPTPLTLYSRTAEVGG